MKREDVIREVQSMLDVGGYQVAKSILKLSEKSPGTFQKIGPSGSGGMNRRPMSQEEALRMVERARRRIELVDSTS